MKVIILIAEGFEEIETATVYDVLKRAGVDVITAGLNAGTVTGSRGLKIVVDEKIGKRNVSDIDGLVVPGGYPGYVNLANSPEALKLIKEMADKGKHLASICAGPVVLEKAGVITGRTVTCFPGMEDELQTAIFSPERVVQDGNIITSRGPGTALDFALKLAEAWVSPDVARKLREEMVA